MISFFKDKSGARTVVTQTMSHEVGEYLDAKIWQDLTTKIVDAWFKEYGADVIKQLAPKKVKATVSKIIEDKLAEKFYN